MNKIIAAFLIAIPACCALAQVSQKPKDEQVIRISTELVQVDVVVTDKKGRVVRGLTKDDFTLSDSNKQQQISFFEFVEPDKPRQGASDMKSQVGSAPSGEKTGVSRTQVNRIFVFIVDDLTMRYEDMSDVRRMLAGFVDARMQPTDLVAIVRTVGGRGLLQTLSSDKDLLRRAIASLTAVSNPLNVFRNGKVDKIKDPIKFRDGQSDEPTRDGSNVPYTADASRVGGAYDSFGEAIDIDDPAGETSKNLRAAICLGTASFVIDSLKQLPGRKAMLLISGGLPILNVSSGAGTSQTSNYMQEITDKAARAGVTIHTFNVSGFQDKGVANFDDTPGRSSMGTDGSQRGFGRTPDATLVGGRYPIDALENQQGLRSLAAETGGIAVLSRNNFDEGLDKIMSASEGYYLLAYTPSEGKFNGDFRKLEIKVRGDYRVYSRRGYLAREAKPADEAATKQQQILAAIQSPLARREIDLDSMLIYRAASLDKGAVEIRMVIDAKNLSFEQTEGKHRSEFDVVGFIFDELGKLRGGFSETLSPSLTDSEYEQMVKSGFTYSANTTVPSGWYQVHVAVRDSKTGRLGSLSRFFEVPDLSKGRLSSSTLMLGAVEAKSSSSKLQPLDASRRISRKQDLRYAAAIYNARLKNDKPHVKTQLIISQNGNRIFEEPEELLASGDPAQVVKIGQLGLGSVKPGRYTLTLVITDTLADRKAQTITRSMDFIVED